jgi:hypothetical protein
VNKIEMLKRAKNVLNLNSLGCLKPKKSVEIMCATPKPKRLPASLKT